MSIPLDISQRPVNGSLSLPLRRVVCRARIPRGATRSEHTFNPALAPLRKMGYAGEYVLHVLAS